MLTVQDFIYDLEGEQRAVFEYLDELISGFPEMESKIRYRIPFYFRKSWICYLNPKKNGGMELCFLRANELADAGGILNFKDRTQVAGIEISSLKDIPEEGLREILMEAILLDETIPYKSKRSGK